MSNDFYVVNVEAAIFNQGRYLTIIRSRNKSHAAGAMAFPGGKIEGPATQDVLEATLAREVNEEVTLNVEPPFLYLESNLFVADDGQQVVNIVFLCRYWSGTPTVGAPEEVKSVTWLTADTILSHPSSPVWMRKSTQKAEALRKQLGW